MRHLPEFLCFVYHCAANSVRLPPISLDDVPSLSPEAAVGAYVFEEESIHTGQVRSSRRRHLHRHRFSPITAPLLQGVPYPPGTPGNYYAQLFGAIRRNFSDTPSVHAGDFLASVTTPMYNFLKHEILTRQKEDVGVRVMYDDVNESLWHRDRVLRLLPDEVPLTASYSHLRAKLSGDLNKYFAKTFCERTSYLNVWQVYYRVYTLHLVALHLTFMLAFFGLSPPWLLTATVTHAFCKILRQVGDIVIGHPPRGADSLSFDAKDEEPDESCEASCATERMSLISNASK